MSMLTDPIHGAMLHRGVSHSLLFALLFSPAFAYVIFRLYKRKYSYNLWLKLFFISIVTHPILDMFTNYGTQFLWPFPNRITFNTVFVIDPLYTLPFMVMLLVAMALGYWLSGWIESRGITLPAYIGAMLVAALIRNLDDMTGWFGLSMRILDTIGAITLSLFLVLALMTLELWELAGLAMPLLVSLLAQIALILVSVPIMFRLMGRDYEASVMGGGFIGFMLGTTANAMAVMRTLVERYGPAPRAFLVAPVVGAFFIDFTNALLVTWGINILR